jgi:elongation factor P hydroxylase
MPKCEGRPNSACPRGVIDKSVHLCQGDLMLCKDCEEFRFPHVRRADHCEDSRKGSVNAVNAECLVTGSQKATGKSATVVTEAGIVVNELLAYANYYMHQATSDKIHKVLVNFYTSTEIDTAKDVVWNVIGDDSQLGKRTLRRDTVARSAADANASDIIQVLKLIDSSDSKMVTFTAVDLSRVPKYAPEELTLFSLIDKVAGLYNEMAIMKNDIAALQLIGNTPVDVSGVISEVTVLKQEVADLMVRRNTVVDPPDDHGEKQSDMFLGPTLTSSLMVGSMESADDFQQQRQQRRKERRRLNRLVNGQLNDGGADVSAPSHSGSLTFRPTVVNPGAIDQRQAKRKMVIGNKKSDKVLGATRSVELFIYRVCPDTDDNEIRSLFDDANIDVIEFEKVSHVAAPLKSYCVRVALADLNKVCNEDFLPENVACRRFYKPRPVSGIDDCNGQLNDGGADVSDVSAPSHFGPRTFRPTVVNPGAIDQRQAKRKMVIGNKKSDKVLGATRSAELFIYRVCPDTDDNEIRSLFDDANIDVIEFEKVSHVAAALKSYHVRVTLADLNKICNEDFLPLNVACRRYYKHRPGQNSNGENVTVSDHQHI